MRALNTYSQQVRDSDLVCWSQDVAESIQSMQEKIESLQEKVRELEREVSIYNSNVGRELEKEVNL